MEWYSPLATPERSLTSRTREYTREDHGAFLHRCLLKIILDPRTVFWDINAWPLFDSADPLEGWNMAEVYQQHCGPASSDLYGKLYFYLKRHLRVFLKRISSFPVDFQLLQIDARDLSAHMHMLGNDLFSRIEVRLISSYTISIKL